MLLNYLLLLLGSRVNAHVITEFPKVPDLLYSWDYPYPEIDDANLKGIIIKQWPTLKMWVRYGNSILLLLEFFYY